MQVASPWFYFVLMPLFIFEGWLIARFIPFYSDLKRQEVLAARISSIDGLRGVLALSVFFLHCVEYHVYLVTGIWTAPASNFYAQLGVASVTMFFFITGYVFWKKARRRTTTVTYRILIPERLRRLGGAYAFACLFLFVLVAIASSFHLTVSVPVWLLQHLLWLTFLGSGHQINGIMLSKVWLGPAWTLRSEWYFYLALPVIQKLATNGRRLIVLLACSALAAAALGNIHLSGPSAAIVELFRAFSMFLAYMFGTGMIVAQLRLDSGSFGRFHKVACAAALILLCATLMYSRPAYGPLESALLAFPFALICSGTDFGFLSSAPLLLLGRLSYSFYLLHLLVLGAIGMLLASVLRPVIGNAIGYWLFCALCGTVAIALSAFSYRWIEVPLMQRTGKRAASGPALQQEALGTTFALDTGIMK
jgi:peptidoglycan/LPS O-acetylase OafA/YrhL